MFSYLLLSARVLFKEKTQTCRLDSYSGGIMEEGLRGVVSVGWSYKNMIIRNIPRS